MKTSISASWLLKGYFDLSTQDRNLRTTQEIRRHLCEAIGLSEMEMASYPVGAGWRHVFWWRETKADFAEAQFVAAISEEYPMLSLGISVEKGRATATKNRPALDPTWDWHNLLRHLHEVLTTDVRRVSENLGKPLNLRIRSKPTETPDTAGWKTRGFSLIDGQWFERHVGEVRGDKVDAIADRIRELNDKKDTWVVLTFTCDLSPSEADDMSSAAVAEVLLKFNPLRERLRGREPKP
jgi:hypothetical protein